MNLKPKKMADTLTLLAQGIRKQCAVIAQFAIDAAHGQIDNFEDLGARTDTCLEATQHLVNLIGLVEEELSPTIAHARAGDTRRKL